MDPAAGGVGVERLNPLLFDQLWCLHYLAITD